TAAGLRTSRPAPSCHRHHSSGCEPSRRRPQVRLTILILILLALTLAYGVFWYGGVVASDWNICQLALGLISLFYWAPLPARRRAPRLEPWLRWPILLLPCYVLFQLIPLPLS